MSACPPNSGAKADMPAGPGCANSGRQKAVDRHFRRSAHYFASLAIRPFHLSQDVVDAEARRLLSRREVPECLDELRHESLSRDDKKRPLERPVVVRV